MALQLGVLRDALIKAGASPELAGAAAEEIVAHLEWRAKTVPKSARKPLRFGALRDALVEAGAGDDLAQATIEEIRAYEDQIADQYGPSE